MEIHGIGLIPVGLNLYICYCPHIQNRILDLLPSMVIWLGWIKFWITAVGGQNFAKVIRSLDFFSKTTKIVLITKPEFEETTRDICLDIIKVVASRERHLGTVIRYENYPKGYISNIFITWKKELNLLGTINLVHRRIFRKTNICYPLIRSRTYQGVTNVSFSENFSVRALEFLI